MIRTNSVPLTTIPNAIAYRCKLPSGGSGIVVVRGDEPQPGTATVSKTSGECIVAANTPTGPYPEEAFAEALELTAGMPYHKQGKPAAPMMEGVPESPADEDGAFEERLPQEEAAVVDSDGYQKIVEAYTDKSGKLSYDLLNKDLIRLAHSSDVVARMVSEGASEEDIRMHVVGTRFRHLAGNRNLDDGSIAAMAGLIDEVSPKGAFKDLNAKIRSMLGKSKRS